MVIVTNYRPTSLNLVSDLDPGFLVVFSTPNPPWGLVDTRHGTGIFGLQKRGGGRCFFFYFFFGWGWCFFLLGDIFGMSFFRISWCFFLGGIFLDVFFGDFWQLLLLPGVLFPRETPSVYIYLSFFWFAICQILFLFISFHEFRGDFPRFFCSLNKIEAFFRFQASCVLFFVFLSQNQLRDGRNRKGKIVRDAISTIDIHGRRTITESRGTRHSFEPFL